MKFGRVASALDTACKLHERDIVVRRVTTDSRDILPGDLFFAVRGPRFDGHDFVQESIARGAVAAVVEREVAVPAVGSLITNPVVTLRVSDTVEALGQLAFYYRREVMDAETVVVAVTGSNGKTTTKCMIDHVLGGRLQGRASPKSFNNQLGVPLSILSAEDSDRYLVLEVGTNHPGEIAALASIGSPTVAVITSIGEAHLEGLASLDGVAAEKCSLLDHVRPGGFAVVNVDRDVIWPHLHARPRLRLVTIGFSPTAGTPVKSISSALHGTVSELEGRYRLELPMPGAHHATNAAAAFVVGRWFGIPPWEVLERLRSFHPPEGRTRVLTLGVGTVVDDTYNANPASVAAAIDALSRESPGKRVFVLGDMLELGREVGSHHCEMIHLAASSGIETFVAVGSATTNEARQFGASAGDMRVICCDGLESVVQTLLPLVAAGHTLWLKASRGMQLDQVVARLRTNFDMQTAVA
ncbi:MAG: UDP-N-acetylmuramoyl-tripeptide--D-alanyl-D-alanine ligase [Planctomycetota bacterium]